MKKYYTTSEYKSWQKRKLQKIERKLKEENRPSQGKRIQRRNKQIWFDDVKLPVVAPNDLRLIENTEDCLFLFREIRSEEYLSRKRHITYIILSLKNVTEIDYGTISILTAISDDLKFKRIILRVDFPDNLRCKQFMIDSGFLNHMYDEKGRKFRKADMSDLIFFEKGSMVLSEEDNKKISILVKNVVKHLVGEARYCRAVKTIILEVCGNSIEWSGTESKQWLLGVKYENKRVVFTVTDVGKGILDTLNRKFKAQLADIFTRKTPVEIFQGAFDKKYGSTTHEANRNKGLPAVKANFEQGTIKHLKVLTNNVILHFDNVSNSKTFEKGSPRFKGTFYQWEMTSECLNKIMV